MRGVVLDSDVLIWWLRGREDVVGEVSNLVERANLYVTPVNIAEIWAGVRRGEEKKVKDLFKIVDVLVIDDKVGLLAGRYLNQYRKSHGLELSDALIAGCVERYELKLWTFNIKHYPMLDKRRFYSMEG